jgi:hypothetical protein
MGQAAAMMMQAAASDQPRYDADMEAVLLAK